jgi:hypothetical protein
MPYTSQRPTGTLTNPALAQQLLDAMDALSGLLPHPDGTHGGARCNCQGGAVSGLG